MSDPTGGWADATGKASEAVTEVTKAGRDLGGFLAPPLRELVGIVTDQSQVWRWKRQIRLAEQVGSILKERGLDKATRQVAPSFLVPLIEEASLQDDDDLQDIWARMLANAADAGSETEMRTAFIRMLAEMTSFDVQLLAKIAEATPNRAGQVWTVNLPDRAETPREGDQALMPRGDVEIALVNLCRLGCLQPASALGGVMVYGIVQVTGLGRAFIKACTG